MGDARGPGVGDEAQTAAEAAEAANEGRAGLKTSASGCQESFFRIKQGFFLIW